MKKILSLFMAIFLLFSVFCVISVSAASEDVEYIPLSKEFVKEYWGYRKNFGEVVKVDNWYYYIIKNSENKIVELSVCGYDGDDTNITIPTELDGNEITKIDTFWLFSNTVETITIPKEINNIYPANMYSEGPYSFQWDKNSKLKEIIVDGESSRYKSVDGVLLSKDGRYLYTYPALKEDEEYIVPDTVQYICTGAFAGAKNLEFLTITPSVIQLCYDSIPKKGLKELRFENTELPLYETKGEPPYSYNAAYVPDIPDTVVYCVKGSEMYKLYEQSFEEPEGKCKELRVLPFTETLKKETDGKWYYYCNDYKMYYSNTLVKHGGKWFYVKNGNWDKTFTDEIITYNGKKFYIKNGKWDSNINTLVKKNGEWLGIVNGKWDNTAKTLIKYQGKWFYIKNGKWCKDTAIVKYNGKSFYVKNGKVDFSFSGSKKIGGKTYKIKNGKVA